MRMKVTFSNALLPAILFFHTILCLPFCMEVAFKKMFSEELMRN